MHFFIKALCIASYRGLFGFHIFVSREKNSIPGYGVTAEVAFSQSSDFKQLAELCQSTLRFMCKHLFGQNLP